MSDPAVAAAQRAWDAAHYDEPRDGFAAAAREALNPIRDLHRRVHPVFSWRDGLLILEPCSDCGGKAGIHPCGCWGESDIEYRCLTCRDEKGRLLDWPCATARLVYTEEELS